MSEACKEGRAGDQHCVLCAEARGNSEQLQQELQHATMEFQDLTDTTTDMAVQMVLFQAYLDCDDASLLSWGNNMDTTGCSDWAGAGM